MVVSRSHGGWRTLAVAAAGALAMSAAAGAQGLGEAARKAQEQRKAVGPSTKMTVDDEAFHEIPLTVDLVKQYAETRIFVADFLWNHGAARDRMSEAIKELRRARDVVRVYESMPEVKARIEFQGLTAESFLRLGRTIERARSRADGHSVAKGRDLELQEANTRFMLESYVVLRPTFEKLSWSNTWVPDAFWTLPY